MGEQTYSPTIIYLSTRLRWVVSFTLRPLYPRRKNPRYLLDRRLCAPQAGLDAVKRREELLSPPKIEPRPSNPSLYRLNYPGSWFEFHYRFKPYKIFSWMVSNRFAQTVTKFLLSIFIIFTSWEVIVCSATFACDVEPDTRARHLTPPSASWFWSTTSYAFSLRPQEPREVCFLHASWTEIVFLPSVRDHVHILPSV
jgi:hypothetical protein